MVVAAGHDDVAERLILLQHLDRAAAVDALDGGQDVARPDAAAAAFLLHFMPDAAGELQVGALDTALLACLVERKRMEPPLETGR